MGLKKATYILYLIYFFIVHIIAQPRCYLSQQSYLDGLEINHFVIKKQGENSVSEVNLQQARQSQNYDVGLFLALITNFQDELDFDLSLASKERTKISVVFNTQKGQNWEFIHCFYLITTFKNVRALMPNIQLPELWENKEKRDIPISLDISAQKIDIRKQSSFIFLRSLRATSKKLSLKFSPQNNIEEQKLNFNIIIEGSTSLLGLTIVIIDTVPRAPNINIQNFKKQKFLPLINREKSYEYTFFGIFLIASPSRNLQAIPIIDKDPTLAASSLQNTADSTISINQGEGVVKIVQPVVVEKFQQLLGSKGLKIIHSPPPRFPIFIEGQSFNSRRCVQQSQCTFRNGVVFSADNEAICMACSNKNKTFSLKNQRCECKQNYITVKNGCFTVEQYCGKGVEFFDGKCYQQVRPVFEAKCGLNEQYDYEIRECVCFDRFLRNETNVCCQGKCHFYEKRTENCTCEREIINCTKNFPVYNSLTGQCECEEGKIKDGDHCVCAKGNIQYGEFCCSKHALFDPDKEKCSCKFGFSGNGIFCRRIPPSKAVSPFP